MNGTIDPQPPRDSGIDQAMSAPHERSGWLKRHRRSPEKESRVALLGVHPSAFTGSNERTLILFTDENSEQMSPVAAHTAVALWMASTIPETRFVFVPL